MLPKSHFRARKNNDAKMGSKKQRDFSSRVLVGITGCQEKDWRNKLREIEKLEISKVSLFLERFSKKQRKKLYQALLELKIKQTPLVHIRHDMEKEELEFLSENFQALYFTIHEDDFKVLEKWKGFYKHLFLEMNFDNFVQRAVDISRIGGFCIDLAHFKVGATKYSQEFKYVLKRRNVSRYFACNHLSGYCPEKNTDLHTVKSLKDFDYLRTLPKFLFSNVLAIEVDNSITEQLKFKKYLSKLLKGSI